VQSARINGKELTRAWITHDEIVSGSTLEFIMGSSPNIKWGADPAQLPPDTMRPSDAI
jgi:putative alpha-1,2-mannosidase